MGLKRQVIFLLPHKDEPTFTSKRRAVELMSTKVFGLWVSAFDSRNYREVGKCLPDEWSTPYTNYRRNGVRPNHKDLKAYDRDPKHNPYPYSKPLNSTEAFQPEFKGRRTLVAMPLQRPFHVCWQMGFRITLSQLFDSASQRRRP